VQRAQRIAVWTARLLLAALFVATGTMKLMAHPESVAAFERLGLGAGFRIFIGICELSGALGLLVSPLAALAALGLAALMVAAVLCHILVLGSPMAPALMALALALFVAWSERTSLRLLGLLRSGKGPMDGWVARAYDRGVQAAFHEMLPALTSELLPELASARRVLDVGCGPGQFTVFIAEALPAAEVWGIDLAPTMIELARAHAGDSPAAARLHFEVADVARLPFTDGMFEAVISSGSIKHWPDAIAGLREIHRVLARDGRGFVAEMNRLAPPSAIAAQRRRLRHWFFRWIYPRVFTKALSPEEARGVFAASPFRSVARERMLLDGCIWVFEARKV
jgi:ubiquinone/menaquinone biosynthesis C-methylase UbiE/uncharacterized membrane protein YphA (DoxX/SURF4 family)